MRIAYLTLFFCAFSFAQPKTFPGMPEWVVPITSRVDFSQPPADASVWQLLDETTVTQLSNNQWRVEQKVIKYVLEEGGSDEAALIHMSNSNEGKVQTLKGWHLPESAKVQTVKKKDMVMIGTSDIRKQSQDMQSFAAFEYVAKGSLVAYHTVHTEPNFFSKSWYWVRDSHPTFQKRIRLVSQSKKHTPIIKTLNFEPWGLDYELSNTQLVIKNIPKIKSEILKSDEDEDYPQIEVAFIDANDQKLSSWDSLAKWYYHFFNKNALSNTGNKGLPLTTTDTWEKVVYYFDEQITYRQRYMSYLRGWTPAAGETVVRRAYGDCKDMVSCLASKASKENFSIYPVLANIADGPNTTAANSPGPLFNHLIAAIPLKDSLGYPAEIETEAGRFLIFDPTAKFTQKGHLPAHYKGRNILICTPSGAQWVAIPDTALEEAALDITLSGLLDQNFTFSGRLQITEQGDSHFLRQISKTGNSQDLEATVIRSLDLPSTANITLQTQDFAEGKFKLTYQIQWPSFLRRDADGVRLPFAIIGHQKRSITKKGETRQNPIEIDRQPRLAWTLSLTSEVPLFPGREKVKFDLAHHQLNWTASGGTSLEVSFSKTIERGRYPLEKLEDGVSYWTEYRRQFNDFWVNATLFRTSN